MRPLVRALPCAAVASLIAAVAPAPAGTPLPPVRNPADAEITFANTAKTTSLDSRGRFTFAFGARAGTTGTVTFTTPRKVLKLGEKTFRVAADGTGTITYRLPKSDIAALKKIKTVRVTATVTSTAGEIAKRGFKLRAR